MNLHLVSPNLKIIESDDIKDATHPHAYDLTSCHGLIKKTFHHHNLDPKQLISPVLLWNRGGCLKISNQNTPVDQVAFGQGYRDEPFRSQDSSEFQTLEFQVPATKFDDQGDPVNGAKNKSREKKRRVLMSSNFSKFSKTQKIVSRCIPTSIQDALHAIL